MMKKTFYLSSVLCALLCNSNIVAQVGINTNAPEAMLHINGNLRVRNLEKDYPQKDLQQMMWDESTKELVPAQIKTTQFIYPKIVSASQDLRSEETKLDATAYTINDGHLFITSVDIVPNFSNGDIYTGLNKWLGIHNMTIYNQENTNPTWKTDNVSTYFAYAVRPAPSTSANWTLLGKVPAGHDHVIVVGNRENGTDKYTYSNSAFWEFNIMGIRKEFIYVKNWYETSRQNNTNPSNQQNPYEVTADSDGNASLPEDPLANLPY